MLKLIVYGNHIMEAKLAELESKVSHLETLLSSQFAAQMACKRLSIAAHAIRNINLWTTGASQEERAAFEKKREEYCTKLNEIANELGMIVNK